MDPEEARAKAASRKASRMASRERGEPEETVVKVEELGDVDDDDDDDDGNETI